MEPKVSIDYVTITCREEDSKTLAYLARRIQDELPQTHTRKWRFYGYNGDFYTLLDGHFAVGVAKDATMGMIVQASGVVANKYWSLLLPKPARATRVDLACDVEIRPPDPDLVRTYWDSLHIDGPSHRYYSMVQTVRGISRGGDTLYVGSRTSDTFGRLYDKGAKSKQDAGLWWRYEVELKRDRAKKITQQLLDSDRELLPSLIANFVYDWFCQRGVPPFWFRSQGASLSSVLVIKGKTDEERLVWIKKQVSPTVKRLLEQGQAMETLEALGVKEYFDNWLEQRIRQLEYWDMIEEMRARGGFD